MFQLFKIFVDDYRVSCVDELVHISCNQCQIGIVTVSYTHLDVYKRQLFELIVRHCIFLLLLYLLLTLYAGFPQFGKFPADSLFALRIVRLLLRCVNGIAFHLYPI